MSSNFSNRKRVIRLRGSHSIETSGGTPLTACGSLPPRPKLPKFVVDSDIHHLNVPVVAVELVAGGDDEPGGVSDLRRNNKALVIQTNKIVFDPR